MSAGERSIRSRPGWHVSGDSAFLVLTRPPMHTKSHAAGSEEVQEHGSFLAGRDMRILVKSPGGSSTERVVFVRRLAWYRVVRPCQFRALE